MMMPRLEGYRFGRLVVNGEEQTRDVIVLLERVVTNWCWRTLTRLGEPPIMSGRTSGALGHRYWSLRADAPRSGRRASPPLSRRFAWGGNRSGSHVITSWGERCEEDSGDCVRDTQRGPEAEICLRRQHAAEYQEQHSEWCRQQQEKTGPANAGAPPPPNQDLPQQYRSNYQDQECKQEDRVANLALGSASGDGVQLDAVPRGHCCERERRNNDSGLSQSAQPVTT